MGNLLLSLSFATIFDKYAPPHNLRETGEFAYSKHVQYLGDDPKGRDCIIIEDYLNSVLH